MYFDNAVLIVVPIISSVRTCTRANCTGIMQSLPLSGWYVASVYSCSHPVQCSEGRLSPPTALIANFTPHKHYRIKDGSFHWKEDIWRHEDSRNGTVRSVFGDGSSTTDAHQNLCELCSLIPAEVLCHSKGNCRWHSSEKNYS